MDCSPSTTGTVATVKACSQSSADSGYTPVEHPSSLATVRACSQSSAESAPPRLHTPVLWDRAHGARSAQGFPHQVMGLP